MGGLSDIEIASRSSDAHRPDRREGRTLILLSILLLLAGFICMLSFQVDPSQAEGFLPVSLKAGRSADYSRWDGSRGFTSLDISIIGEVIQDLSPRTDDLEARLTLVGADLLTPVPTITPRSLLPTSTATASRTPTPSPVPSRTATGWVGTIGPPTLTKTAVVTSAGTLVVPSKTATPGSIPTGSSTPAAATPTRSPTPTGTKTATPTVTPPPPSATPTLDLCSGISLKNFGRSGQQIWWKVHNNSGQVITISALYLDWPEGNEGLVKIELAGDAIWDQGDDDPPTSVSGGWKAGVSRSIGINKWEEILFQFDEPAEPSGYDIRLTFQNGCRVSAVR